jgi:hypothetical protein
MLHYNPRHASSINMPIFRRTNCIITASGIVTLCKRLYSTPDKSIHVVEETCLINSVWLHQDIRSLIWTGENAAIKNLSRLWGLQGMDWVLTSNALSVIHNIRLLRPLTFSFQPFKCQASTLAKALFNSSAHYGVVFYCLDEKGVHLMGHIVPQNYKISFYSFIYILSIKTLIKSVVKVLMLLTFRRRDLNPPLECHRAEVFSSGVLICNAYSYKKKSYLIDFSSKCKEIKFRSMFMNWPIW